MEDNDFVTLGSALPQCDDDEIQSRKPVAVHDQVVRDEQGRIRFHGAFTGGFSAGYFNSVDTKEGWVPKNFKSSRSSRSEKKSSQKPEDFMDEEDFGEFGIAPKKLFSSDKYKGSLKRSWGAPQENSLLSLFSNSHLQQCVQPAKLTVGEKLLKKMGWKNADVNSYLEPERDDVFGCSLPPSLVAKQLSKKSSCNSENCKQSGSISVINFSIQINQFGLGYIGLTPQVAKQTDYVPSRIKSRGIKGQGFGVGALEEEDDDIYAGDNASNYNTVLYMDDEEPIQIPSKPLVDRRERGAIDGFKKSSGTPVQVKVYPPPVISGDFVLNVGISQTVSTKNSEPEVGKRKSHWVQTMNSFKRGEMLGETAQIRSVFDMISEKDRLRLEESRRNCSLPKSEEPEKQLNLENTNNKITPIHDPPSTETIHSGDNKEYNAKVQQIETVTEWEKEQKRESSVKVDHFSRTVMMGRFTKASENDATQEVKEKSAKEKAASQNMFGRLTREVVAWHPHKYLCVRFNVEDPYPESTITGIPGQKHSKISIFDVLSRDALTIREPPHPPTETLSKARTNSEEGAPISKPLAILSKVDLRPSVDESERLNLIPADNCDIPEVEKHENKDQAVADQTVEIKDTLPPSVDIFKAIFEDDDEESSDEEDENKDLIQQSDKNEASEIRSQNWFENINPVDSLKVQQSNTDIVNLENHQHNQTLERSTMSDNKKQKKEKHKSKKHKHSHKSHKKSKKSKRAREDSDGDSDDSSQQSLKKSKKSKRAREDSDDIHSDADSSSHLSKTDKYLLSKLRRIS